MKTKDKSARRSLPNNEVFFARNPVVTLNSWAEHLDRPTGARLARERARYYTRTGKLRMLTRGLYAVVPPGADPKDFLPDPYLVAASLRPDAIISHHAAFDLLGISHSLFNRFAYYTANPRRSLQVQGMNWHALRHPAALTRARKTGFGVVTLDRQGVLIRATNAERTLVDGFAGLRWVGGLEEHVASAAALRDLDLDLIERYLKLMDQHILYSAVGWFLENHPEVLGQEQAFLQRLEKHVPRQPLYLGKRQPGGRLEPRWNIVIPPYLSSKTGFEGVPQ
jgi:predicted transcriptional regulator of viral defense system